SVGGAATADQRSTARLARRFRRTHGRWCMVRKLGVPAAGPVVALADSALEDDQTLFLPTGALADEQQVAIINALDPPSLAHHRLVRYAARSDAGGYFRLPPLSRIGQVQITAVSPPPPAPPALQATRVCVPDYGADEYRLDLLLA